MNATWLQWLIVALLVLAAAVYVTWRLAPATLRQRVRMALGIRRKSAGAGPGTDCDNCRGH